MFEGIVPFKSLPPRKEINRLIEGGKFKIAEKLNNWSKLFPNTIILITLVVVVVAGFGITKMDYNGTILDDLRPGNVIYDDIQYFETHLGGTLPIEIIIDSGEEDATLKPDFLSKIELFTEA